MRQQWKDQGACAKGEKRKAHAPTVKKERGACANGGKRCAHARRTGIIAMYPRVSVRTRGRTRAHATRKDGGAGRRRKEMRGAHARKRKKMENITKCRHRVEVYSLCNGGKEKSFSDSLALCTPLGEGLVYRGG